MTDTLCPKLLGFLWRPHTWTLDKIERTGILEGWFHWQCTKCPAKKKTPFGGYNEGLT